jgi:FkbM family methyltransferase
VFSEVRLAEYVKTLKYVYRLGLLRGVRLWLQSRSGRGEVTIRLKGHDAPIYLRPRTSDVPTFEKVFILREYDFPYPVEQPELIVDAGANVGFASILFARMYPSSRILAVEPEPANYELLLKNTASLPNVTAIRAALWRDSGPVHITNPAGASWAFRVEQANASDIDAVPGVTVPELMAQAGVEHIDILKLDIEGGEKEVFESGTEAWLHEVSVIVIELHDRFRDGCSTAFYRATSQLPFHQHLQRENVFLVRREIDAGAAPDR